MSQIKGSGPINKYETLMMVGILMHMMMLRVMRGTNLEELRGIGESEDQAIEIKKLKIKKYVYIYFLIFSNLNHLITSQFRKTGQISAKLAYN